MNSLDRRTGIPQSTVGTNPGVGCEQPNVPAARVARSWHSRYARPMTRLGTWNLENLARRGGPAGAPGDPTAYEEKLDALATTITDLHSDVLAIEEVLDPNALDDLIDRLDGSWRTALADPHPRRVPFPGRVEQPRTDPRLP